MNAPQSSDHPAPSQSAYLVVARRYRPRTFSELVGQSHVVQALVNAIESDRVGHAYLFTGARGVGKTSTARIFAKCLNAPNGPTTDPDDSSDICRLIDAGEDIDVIEIDGASNRGIDEIRQLRAGVNIRPSRARYKIYIIDEVHMLTPPAFNALLKTLEEPPAHVKFIFCTTDPDKIPITVLSRCQRYDFAPVEIAELVARLEQIMATEGREAEPEALQLIARHAAGSVRDSQSLLEQLLAFTTGRVSVADVHRMFGTAPDAHLAQMLDHLLRGDAAAALETLDGALTRGIDAGQFAEQLVSCFRDGMLAATGADAHLRWHSGSDVVPVIDRLAKDYGLSAVLAALQVLDQTLTRIRHSSQPRTLVEMALVRISHLRQLKSIDALIAGTAAAAPSRPQAAPQVAPVRREPPATPIASRSQPNSASASPPTPSPVTPPSSAPTAPVPAPPESSPARGDPPTQTIQPVAGSGDMQPLSLWQTACAQLRDRIGPYGEFAHAARWEPPQSLVVEFPQGYTLQKERCERPAVKSLLEQTLAHLAGKPVRLELRQSETGTPTPPSEASSSPIEQRRKRERAPLVRRAMDLFDADVSRVDDPPDGTN